MLVTLGVPDLKAKHQVGSQESRVEGKNPLPVSAAHTAGEEPQDPGFSGLPAHMACLWPAFIPPLPPATCQQSWSQSVCPSACVHMQGSRYPGPGVPMQHLPQATNTQAMAQQRETHEAFKTWGTFVEFKNFPGLLK